MADMASRSLLAETPKSAKTLRPYHWGKQPNVNHCLLYFPLLSFGNNLRACFLCVRPACRRAAHIKVAIIQASSARDVYETICAFDITKVPSEMAFRFGSCPHPSLTGNGHLFSRPFLRWTRVWMHHATEIRYHVLLMRLKPQPQ